MIVLYNPRSTRSSRPPLPLSLLALASTLEGRFPYEIVDANVEADPVARVIDLGRSAPLRAVGMTVMPGPQLDAAVADSRRLKAALPGVPIAWGGYFPSQHAEVALRDPAVDFCIAGQGERTFVALLDALSSGGALSAIDGLAYEDAGTVRRNPPAPLLALEELPDWPYDRLDMSRYLHRHYLGERVAAHQSSYGCAFQCSFCGIVPVSKGRWVAQSSGRTAAVVEMLHGQYGADAVQFYDMDFFISEPRVAEFAERIRPLGVRWWGQGRVDELMRYGDATWRLMAASGLKMVFSGVETASEDRLRHMNKGGKAKPALAIELASRMKANGVVPEFSFVLGTPPDPMADAEATIGFIREIKRVNPETEVILYIYAPVPVDGTLSDEARALGFRYPETLDEWTSDAWRGFALRRDPRTPWMDPRMHRKVRDFERVLNAYYPTVTDSGLTGLKRMVLRALGGWRYKTRVYTRPLELRLFHRLFHYQRPETAGF